MAEYEAPIPGMSLTETPQNRPYERPPQIVDVEEAIQTHVARLSDKTEDMIDGLEMGLDVETLTKGLLRSAVAEGVHTLDVAILIAPAIHEYIKTTAQSMQIDFEEGFENEQEVKDRREVIRASKLMHTANKIPREELLESSKNGDDKMESKEEETINESLTEGPLSSGGFMTRPSKEMM